MSEDEGRGLYWNKWHFNPDDEPGEGGKIDIRRTFAVRNLWKEFQNTNFSFRDAFFGIGGGGRSLTQPKKIKKPVENAKLVKKKFYLTNPNQILDLWKYQGIQNMPKYKTV